MPTTEIAVFPLKAGYDVGDPSNPSAAVAKDTFDTLRTIDGMQQIYFAPWVENPSNLQLMIDWEQFQHHKDFMASNTYKPFLERFLSIVDGAPQMCHVDFQPAGALNRCFSAPATEVATFYFDGEPPSDYIDNAMTALNDQFKDAEGLLGGAVGITHEELEFDGGKGKAAVLAIGWQSVDAHMDFRGSQSFKDNIHMLRSSAKKIEMHHCAFMQYQR